jgi:hypothetical protein
MPSDCSSSDDIIISAYVQETSPVLTLLVIYAVLGAMCLPLLLAVFFFSTPRIRRTPLFIVVVFDILLGVAIACWMISFTVCHRCSIWVTARIMVLTDNPQLGNLLKPLKALRSESTRSSFIAMVFITFTSPWVIDLVLLLRLYAVFPIASTPKRTLCAVFASTTCIKAARLGFCVANMALWVHSVPRDPLASFYSSNNARAIHSWLSKVVSACELIDHMCVQLVQLHVVTVDNIDGPSFVAACFLWKIRVFSFGPKPAVCPKDGTSGECSLGSTMLAR